MPITVFKNGIFATPNLPGSAGIPPTTGKIWFVDSTTGSSAHDGKSPTTALATIDQAINKCTANKGDQIWVMPNHAETISGATTLVPDVAGISIFGLGEGRDRPTLTFSATSSKIAVSGAGTRISNFVFIAGISAVVIGVDVNADDVTITDCEFNYSTTAFDFVIFVDVDAYDRCTISNCYFIAEDTAGSNQAIRLDDAHDVHITNCVFMGDWTNAMIYSASGDAYGKGLLISGCSGQNSDVTLGANIRLACAFLGILQNNGFSTAYTGSEYDTFDPGSCGTSENYVSFIPDGPSISVPFGGAQGWRMAKKSITYYGGSATAALAIGTVGTYGYFKVSGTIEATLVGIVGTNLAGASATISVGVTGATNALLGVTTGTDLDANEVWLHTAGAASAAAWTDMVHVPVVIAGAASPSIFHTVAVADVSGGQCDFHLYWRPLEPSAHVRPT